MAHIYKTVQVKCIKCSQYVIATTEDDKLDEPLKDYLACSCEYPDLMVFNFDDMQNPDAFLTWAEMELENANWHSATDLPHEIFMRTQHLVSENNRTKLAKAIAEAIVNQI